jgi:hypothetical protein
MDREGKRDWSAGLQRWSRAHLFEATVPDVRLWMGFYDCALGAHGVQGRHQTRTGQMSAKFLRRLAAS